MKNQEQFNYQRIAKAINYISANFKEQPSLDEIAGEVGVSPFHFQRMFTNWAGVSPKKFIQYLSIDYAKQLLKSGEHSLLDTAYETGLSGTSRLHDMFINIEAMTPGEYKNQGASLKINYSFAESPFGKLIVASTEKGICHISFEIDQNKALANLQSHFPKAHYDQIVDQHQQNALFVFQKDLTELEKIKLHLHGTDFQLKVWESLLKIPMGNLSSYGVVAKDVGNAKASRAVGTAIGHNPVAYLIPCHRVIQAGGNLGGYMWGNTRKAAIIGWEAASTQVQ